MPQSKNFENIFNIKANYQFLPSLTAWVLDKYQNPLDLAKTTILLPSRRACRAIKNCFLEQSKNGATILPKILAIGDVDYDQIIDSQNFLSKGLNSTLNEDFKQNLNLENDDKIIWQLSLVEAIKSWNRKHNLFDQNLSVAAFVGIANNLQSFLDEVEKEGLNLTDLKLVADEDLAGHKQKILQFLQYFGGVWQNNLIKKGLISDVKKRNLMLQNYRQFLIENAQNENNNPIIIAGSTGSVKEARELLKTIASIKNGFVVLFGLEKFEEEFGQNLGKEIEQEIADFHPQFMLKKLLQALDIKAKNVIDIKNPQFKNVDNFISKMLSRSMLPAKFCHLFKDNFLQENLPKQNISKIDAKNEFEEARIIALILRETLETPNKKAALISNDKGLIDLVKNNLSKWQIEIDDSASSDLSSSKLAEYLFLISEFALLLAKKELNGVDLLAILKHPLSKFSANISDNFVDNNLYSQNLKNLELEILRNVIAFDSFEQLILKVKNQNLSIWLEEIANIFKPLILEFKKENISFKNVIKAHFNCLFNLVGLQEKLSDLEEKIINFLNNIEGGIDFWKFLECIKTIDFQFNLEPESYNLLLKNCLKNYPLTKFGNFHPRLHVLSTIEARLINYDLIIVSGLIEGQFPAFGATEDWLGSKIRLDFGLPSFEQKIAIAASDFCHYLNQKEVILTHPQNYNNSPTVKSRFLLKLETILRVNDWEEWLKNGDKYKKLLFDENQFLEQQEIKRANPQPFLKFDKNLLSKISATDISKWLQNPYSIYAKRILQLKPLKPIAKPASFAEFGSFVHKILENFIKNYHQIDSKKRLEFLIGQNSQEIFNNYFPDQTSFLLWWERFKNIAVNFIKQETFLRQNSGKTLLQSFVEVEARLLINQVVLTTKIDRINLYLDGSLEIIDYKTGALPLPKKIKNGLEPQLSVEAIILSEGEIKGELKEQIDNWAKNYSNLNLLDKSIKMNLSQIKNLQYQSLKGGNKSEIKNFVKNIALKEESLIKIGSYEKIDLEKLLQATKLGISRLLEIFINENLGFIACPDLEIYEENKDDYWHLARIGEI